MNSAVSFENKDNINMIDRANVRTPVKDIPSLTYDCSSSPFYSSPRSLFGNSSNADHLHYVGPHNRKDSQKPIGGPYLRGLETHYSANGLNVLTSSPPSTYAYGMDDKANSPIKLRQQPFRQPALGAELRKSYESQQRTRLNNYKKANDDFVQYYRHLEHVQPRAGKVSTASINTRPSTPPDTHSKKRRSSHLSKPKLKRISEKEDCTNFMLSAHVFSKACEAQKTLLSVIPPSERAAQTEDTVITKNLCFESRVDAKGRVSIISIGDARSPLTSYTHFDESRRPSNHPVYKKRKEGKFYNIKQLIGDQDLDWDSENEEEHQRTENDIPKIPKTPPRFGNLGSCDAAAAFAKTLTRSRNEGFGSLFMFPMYNTPDSTRITPYIPCTPRVPSEMNEFEESTFAVNVMTPPGAIYTYEQNAMFTGLTPFLVNDQDA